MRLNKIILFVMAVSFLFITSSIAIVINPPTIPRNFTSPGTYYHSSGNLAYFAVDHVMTFTQVVVDSTYVEFNNTKFNISSPNRINISLEYIDSDMTASTGTTLVSFYAQTTTGNARFNISSFSIGASYEVFKNNVSMATPTANATGFIYFTNSVWTTAYFKIALLSGVLPSVTTNAATNVEETTAILNGNATNITGVTSYGFQYGTTIGYGGSISISNMEYIYVAGATTQKVYQYWISNMTKKAETASYGGTIYTLTQDSTYIYVGGATTNKVYQYWKSNMTKKAETASYGGTIYTLTQDSTYIYAAGATTQKVYQYWKSNMTKKAETASYGGTIYALTSNDTYIYAGGSTTDKVYQYWKSNLTKKAESANLGIIDDFVDDSTYIYVGGANNKVYQCWKSNLTKKSETADYGANIYATAQDSTYIYAGGETTRKVYQYWKSNMTKKIETLTYGGTIWDLAQDSIYIYAAGATTQKVYQYWKSNMTKKAETLSYGVGGTIYALALQGALVSNFSYDINSLTPGQLYHFRAFATNSNGTSYGSDLTFFTKPNEPTGLTVTDTSSGQQTLAWTHGTGYNQSVVRGTIGSYPTTPQTGTAIYNNTGNSVIRSGLTYGNDWCYRVWEYTVWGSSFKFSDTYTQSHLKVYNISTITTNATIGIEETNATLKGFLANNGSVAATCGFWYDTDSGLPYATNHSNGVVTNHTAFTYNAPLSPGTRYYARAWASNAMGFVYGSETSFVTKPNAPDTTSFTISSNTRSLGLNWTKGTGTNQTLIVRKLGHYPLTKTDGTIVYNGTGSTYTDTGLTPGVGYGYRAWSYTIWGTTWQFSDLNASACKMTKPEGPTYGNVTLLNLYSNGTMKVRMNWTKGQGANNTLVIKNNAHPPTAWTDGTIIYNGTGTNFDTYIPYLIGSPEYYGAWSYAAWIINPHLYEISANMTTITLGALGGLLINCFDETTNVNLTFNVQISNHNGSSVYIQTGCVNTEVINATLCPQGTDITVIISSTNHSQRTYLLDIYPGIIYLMNTYLPKYVEPGEPGYDINETYSSLYYLRVVETIETGYTQVDQAIENALVTVKRYVNTTDTFDIVSSAYTDANGYINLYMLPFVHYKVFISKSGYDDMISDYIPAPPNTWGQTAEKVFRIIKTTTTPGYNETHGFWDLITFNAVMYLNNTIKVTFIDNDFNTTNAQFYTYELYNFTSILISTNTTLNDTFIFWIQNINSSRTHQINIYLNQTTLGYQYLSILVLPVNHTGSLNVTDIENKITAVLGSFALGFVKFLLVYIPAILLLILPGKKHPGFGIIAAGLWMGFAAIKLAIPPQLAVLVPFIIAIGIILMLVKEGGFKL